MRVIIGTCLTLVMCVCAEAKILPPVEVTNITPFDSNNLNHTYPETRDNLPVYAPITYSSYFKTERALFDYYPRFYPSYVSFDPDGYAFLKYGSVIEYRNHQSGEWEYIDIKPFVDAYVTDVLHWSNYQFRGVAGFTDEACIRFDAEGDIYVSFMLAKVNEDGTLGVYQGILLHSRDYMVNWDVYGLPYSFVRFEKRDRYNADCMLRPPVIILSNTWSPCSNYILIPEKQSDGTLIIPSAIKIADNCIGFMAHSGDGNFALTSGGKVFIVYGQMIARGDPSNGVPSYAVTYDIATKTLTSPVFVGYGGVTLDNHNWPAMTIDSDGILHVIINGHHNPFRYVYALQPYSTVSWSSSQSVSGYTSYATMNCDVNNTLHVVTRCSVSGYYFRLTYTRKKAGQAWEPDRHLVIPFKQYYKNYCHKMTIDPLTGRLFLTYYSQSNQICVFKDEYRSYLNIWPDREKQFMIDNNGIVPVGTYSTTPREYQFYNPLPSEICTLVSDDYGDTWRLTISTDY